MKHPTHHNFNEQMDMRIELFGKDMRAVAKDVRVESRSFKNVHAHVWISTAVIVIAIVSATTFSFSSYGIGRETTTLIQEARMLLEYVRILRPWGK